MTTPNVFADEVEYVSNHLQDRDSVVLSLHPHNDEGLAVAAAEAGHSGRRGPHRGLPARNGERTGNVDLVTLGLNMLTQGIDPQIDYSNVPEIRKTVEYCNQIKISERHPYAGSFVFTAFFRFAPGCDQEGALEARQMAADMAGANLENFVWLVPYLPIDPKDVGGSYEAIIRVNSPVRQGRHGLPASRRTTTSTCPSVCRWSSTRSCRSMRTRPRRKSRTRTSGVCSRTSTCRRGDGCHGRRRDRGRQP